AIKIIDAGGTFTNNIDNAGTLISGSELNVLDGGILFAELGSTPTTLAGYGITDALSNSGTSVQDAHFGDIYLKDDTNPSHYLQITNAEDLTGAHSLGLITGDTNRTITLSGNPTLADWFNQSVKSTAAVTFVTVDTGLGAHELYAMDQDVLTTSDVIFNSTTVTNTGLHILDTNASHDLILKPGSDLTADHTLTITTGD